jgi:glycolate oxidase
MNDQNKKQLLLGKLQSSLPASAILSSAEELRPYECDGLSAYRELPLLVVLPETIEQVQAIIRECASLEIPVVARGAGTGLSGGALPLANGVLLGLAKFNRILDIDQLNRTARVQPGVRNLAISEAAAPYGLYYAPDPSSQIACSIGGNVAENSGGVHCLKYGLTVHNILQIKIVTIDGELITIGGSGFDAPGYDVLALMTGSEGMLGIIVEITVKLLPKPEYAQVVMAAFDDVEKAGAAVGDVIAAGSVAEVKQQIAKVESLLNQAGATSIRLSNDDAERELLWKGRKAAFPAVGRISPDYYCMDGTIPRKQLPYVLRRISELSSEYQLSVANVFHAGDGNLHPLILYDANQDGELHKAEELGGKILEVCVEVGGTITGEHGVGVEKINQMCVQFSPLALEQFHAVKAAFDEKQLLNPGKAVPTLHRCAEFGAMHVHEGKLPFPELERF